MLTKLAEATYKQYTWDLGQIGLIETPFKRGATREVLIA